jgi:hypothetical protein
MAVTDNQAMLVATPASIEHAFETHGVLVSQAASPPEICYPAGCTAVYSWGARRPIYFKPRTGKDFIVILFNQQSDAVRLARLEARSGLATARHGSALLLYYKLTPRITRLRAALAASG